MWSCADLDCQCDHPVHYGGSMCAIAGLHESIPAQLGDLRCATRIEVMCASAPPRTTVQKQSSPIFLEFYSKRHSYLRSHCGFVLTMVVSTVEVWSFSSRSSNAARLASVLPLFSLQTHN